jgi:hypothetical protein
MLSGKKRKAGIPSLQRQVRPRREKEPVSEDELNVSGDDLDEDSSSNEGSEDEISEEGSEDESSDNDEV